jgi:hypothetical protein
MIHVLKNAIVSAIVLSGPTSSAFAKGLDTDTDAKSKAVLLKTCNFYKGLKSFNTAVSASNDSKFPKISLAAQKPNLLSQTCKSNKDYDIGNAICDGKSLYLYSPVGNLYQANKAPEKFSGIFKNNEDFFVTTAALNLYVYKFLSEDPYKELVDSDDEFKYVGKEKVGDSECHHLLQVTKKPKVTEHSPAPNIKIKRESSPIHLWIEANESQPWLRRESLTFTMTDTLDSKTTRNKVEIVHDYTASVANPTFDKSKFNILPEKGATKVVSIAKSPERLNAMIEQVKEIKAQKDQTSKKAVKQNPK